MTSSLTPFTDELKRAFETVDSGNNSNVSSAAVSPRPGMAVQRSNVRARSTGATREGMIDGVAVTDGGGVIGGNGVVFDNGLDIPGLKLTQLKGKVPPGFVGASTTSQRTQNEYAAPSFLPGSSGASSSSFFTQRGGPAFNSFLPMNASGINATPREEPAFSSMLGARAAGGGGGAAAAATGGVASFLSSRSVPVGGAATATKHQPFGGGVAGLNSATGDDFTAGGGTTSYDDNEDYDDEEEEETEFDENEQEPSLFPPGFGPSSANPMLGPSGQSRGLTEEDVHRQRLMQKAEFQSFDVVSTLLAVNGAANRRDLLEYHTPVAFLQFLEQLMCGAYFIRFYKKHGTPHERYLYLRMIEVAPGVERPFLCQCKHATAVQIDDAVSIADLIGVEAADTSPAFQRQKDRRKPGFVKGSFVKSKRPFFSTQGALSLYFYDRRNSSMRSLDILTTNMTVFKLWKMSLDALVAVNTVKTGSQPQTVAQNMRALFLAVKKTWLKEAQGQQMLDEDDDD